MSTRRTPLWSLTTGLCLAASLARGQAPPSSEGAPPTAIAAPAEPESSSPPPAPRDEAPPPESTGPTAHPEPPLPSAPAAREAPLPRGAAPGAASLPPPPAAESEAPAAEPPPAEPTPEPVASSSPAKFEIEGRLIYHFQLDRAGLEPRERVARARKALSDVLQSGEIGPVRVVPSGDAVVIYVGNSPLFQLLEDDARLAGDRSLAAHADAAATRVRALLNAEQQRSRLVKQVYSIGMVVLLSLIALYLLRRTNEFVERAREWVATHRERIPALRVQSLEVIGSAAMQSSATLGLELAKWLARGGIVYSWLWLTLSQFSSTAWIMEAFTRTLMRPITDIAGRLASILPLLALGVLVIALVALGLRMIELFFESAARNETVIPYVSADVARPTGTLLKVALVLGALAFAAPILTGSDDGVLPRSAIVALGTLGLATTPLLASVAVGVAVVFSRQLRVGDHVVFGGKRGRVRAIGLLSVVLEVESGGEVRVPQLLSLIHATEILGPLVRTSCEVPLDRTGTEVTAALRRAALSVGTQPQIELLALERERALYRVSVLSDRRDARSALLNGCLTELRAVGVELGGQAVPSEGGEP